MAIEDRINKLKNRVISGPRERLSPTNRETLETIRSESSLGFKPFSPTSNVLDPEGLGSRRQPIMDALRRQREQEEDRLDFSIPETDTSVDTEFSSAESTTPVDTQAGGIDPIRIAEAVDPREPIQHRPLFATEESEEELPYGGAIGSFAVNAVPRMIEAVTTAVIQSGGGLKRGIESLITGEIPEDTTQLPDVQIGQADLSDPTRLGVNEWFGEWDTEGGKIPGPGKVMVDSFDKYEEENPDQTQWNIVKAVAVGPILTALEVVFFSLDIQDLARIGVRRTGGGGTRQALDTLGLSQDDISVRQIREQFINRAENIMDRNPGSLTTQDQIDLNALGNAVNRLGQDAGGRGIPELNKFGRTVQKISETLLDDVAGSSQFGRGRPRGSQPGLPGQRSRPGQAQQAGLSLEEFENVGRTPDDVPTPPAGQRADDVAPPTGQGQVGRGVTPRSTEIPKEFQSDPLSDIGRVARTSEDLETFNKRITEGGDDVSSTRTSRLSRLSESFSEGGRSQLDQDFPNITGEDIDAPTVTEGTVVPTRPGQVEGDVSEVRESGLVDVYSSRTPQPGDEVSLQPGNIDMEDPISRRVLAKDVRQVDGELIYAPEDVLETYSNINPEDYFERVQRGMVSDAGGGTGFIENPLGDGQVMLGNSFSRAGQSRVELIDPNTGQVIDSIPFEQINPQLRTRTDIGEISRTDKENFNPWTNTEGFREYTKQQGGENLPDNRNVFSAAPSINKTRLGDEAMENLSKGITREEAQEIEPDILNPPEVEQLKNELYHREKELMDNPARQLQKYTNNEGKLPEVKGYGEGEFANEGDQIVEELGFGSVDEAQEALDNYRNDLDNHESFKQYVKEVDTINSLTEKNYTMADVSRAVDEHNPPIQISDAGWQDMLHTYFRDTMARLNYIEQEIQEQGARIPESLGAYSEHKLSQGRAQYEMKEFEEYFFDDYLSRVADDNIDIDELDKYFTAVHAPARNRRVAEKTDVKISDGGSGRTNEEARVYIDELEESGRRQLLEDYRQEYIENVQQFNRDLMVNKYKLYSKEQMDDIHFDDDYVHLSVVQDNDSPFSGGGGKLIQEIKGSRAGFDNRHNVLAQGFVDVQKTIVKGEENLFGLKLKNLIEEFPDEDIWNVEKMQYTPDYDSAGEVVGLNQQREFADNEIVVHDGEDRFLITINDKAISSGMKKVGLPNGFKYARTLSNWLRATNTYLNPEFMLGSNLPRDLQLALFNVGADISTAAARNVVKNVPEAMSAIIREETAKGGLTQRGLDAIGAGEETDIQRVYRELKRQGGMMQWSDIDRDVNSAFQEMVNRMEEYANDGTKAKARAALRSFRNAMETFNAPVESGIRLSVAKELIDRGYSARQAAEYASDITVNFRTKGKLAPIMDVGYLFFSVGTQGAWQAAQFMKSKRGMSWVAALTALGATTAGINEMINSELWDSISDEEKDQNWILVLPTEMDEIFEATVNGIPLVSIEESDYGYYLSVRTPYVLNTVKTVGNEMYEVARNGEGRIPYSLKNIFSSLEAGVAPITGGSLTQTLLPTDVVDPFIQVAENKNWFGGPIKPEQQPYQPEVPDSQLYFNSASESSRFITEYLNEATGGSQVESGYIDVSPESIDHIVESYVGGSGTMLINMFNTGESAVSGEAMELTDVPFLNDFAGTPWEGIHSNRLYEMVNKSATKDLSKYEKSITLESALQAINKGELDEETGNRLVGDLIENQNRIEAGKAFNDVKGSIDSQNIINSIQEREDPLSIINQKSDINVGELSPEVFEQLVDIESEWVSEQIIKAVNEGNVSKQELSESLETMSPQIVEYLVDNAEDLE